MFVPVRLPLILKRLRSRMGEDWDGDTVVVQSTEQESPIEGPQVVF